MDNFLVYTSYSRAGSLLYNFSQNAFYRTSEKSGKRLFTVALVQSLLALLIYGVTVFFRAKGQESFMNMAPVGCLLMVLAAILLSELSFRWKKKVILGDIDFSSPLVLSSEELQEDLQTMRWFRQSSIVGLCVMILLTITYIWLGEAFMCFLFSFIAWNYLRSLDFKGYKKCKEKLMETA